MINRFRPFRAALLLLAVPALLSACEKDIDIPSAPVIPGVMYVVNEGNYNSANAAVSRYDRAAGIVVRDQFAAANPDIALGDVAQSMTVVDGKGYVIVNNSNKIVVVRMSDFKQIDQIDSLNSTIKQPRYMAVRAGKGYVTEWLSFTAPGRVTEIDLTTNRPTGVTFAVGVMPEGIIATPAGLIVANQRSNTLSVINLVAPTGVSGVRVPAGPRALGLDASGRAWLLCDGDLRYTAYPNIDTVASTPGALVSFSLANPPGFSLLRQFPTRFGSPANLTFNGDRTQLCFSYASGVYRMATTATDVPRTPFLRRKAGACLNDRFGRAHRHRGIDRPALTLADHFDRHGGANRRIGNDITQRVVIGHIAVVDTQHDIALPEAGARRGTRRFDRRDDFALVLGQA